MAKTTPNKIDPKEFIASVTDEKKRADAEVLLEMMAEITGEPPVMWGPSIVGYGSYHYKYASGREGDWMLTGFSPRKTALSVYLMSGVERQEALLKKLGKYKNGKSCLYIKRLADVDQDILRKLIATSVELARNNDIKY